MIKAIFFATFDVNEGPKLHHLLPPAPSTAGAAADTPSSSASSLFSPPSSSVLPPPAAAPALFDFRTLSAVLIPPPSLCNRPCNVLTPRVAPRPPPAPPSSYRDETAGAGGGGHRILSYPVCIESESYPRNAFTFNCGLVVPAAAEFSSYLPVVRKLATLFRGWEEQGRFLSGDLSGGSRATGLSGLGLVRDDGGVDEDDNGGDGDGDDRGGADPAPPPTMTTTTTSRIYAILEILLEDLNSYGETQIPLPPPFADTLNLKLFPTYPPPPPLHPWQVPLLTVPPATLLDTSEMDLTMARVLPHVDGVNSVARIALLADADLKLVRKAIRHLLFYGCCLLLDIFAFGAIYAPTESVAAFVEDEAMQEECLAYCRLSSSSHPLQAPPPPPSSAATGGPPASTLSSTGPPASGGGGTSDAATTTTAAHNKPPHLTKDLLIELYTSLSQGLTLRAWCAEWASNPVAPPPTSSSPSRVPSITTDTHSSSISTAHPTHSRSTRTSGINPADILDLRRFITFGVIRGFLYRVHRYAVLVSPAGVGPTARVAAARSSRRGKTTGSVSAAVAAGREQSIQTTETGDRHNGDEDHDRQRLRPFLDGTHCFDEICTALGISERELMVRLKGFGTGTGSGGGGEVVILCR